MSKHTPCPWIVESCKLMPKTKQLNSPVAYVVHGHFIDHMDGETRTANEKLIAAAPDMLKMLELAIRELDWADRNCQIKPMAGVSTFKTAVAQIKAVINKATGGD